MCSPYLSRSCMPILDRDIQSSPRRKLGRLPACYFVCERNSVGRIRTEIGMCLEILEHGCDLRGRREESGEDFLWDLFEREFMTLLIQRVDDFVEAHEITDE